MTSCLFVCFFLFSSAETILQKINYDKLVVVLALLSSSYACLNIGSKQARVSSFSGVLFYKTVTKNHKVVMFFVHLLFTKIFLCMKIASLKPRCVKIVDLNPLLKGTIGLKLSTNWYKLLQLCVHYHVFLGILVIIPSAKNVSLDCYQKKKTPVLPSISTFCFRLQWNLIQPIISISRTLWMTYFL